MLDINKTGCVVDLDATAGIHGLRTRLSFGSIESALGIADEMIHRYALARQEVALLQSSLVGDNRSDCLAG